MMEMGVVRAALPRKLPPGERRPAPPKVIGPISYRMITGGFQINIPVRADDGVLTFDEEYLSIFKRRLSVMALTDRWVPILQRYLRYLSARIDGHGGNSRSIAPPPTYRSP